MEIINISIGGTGIPIADTFFKTLYRQHSLGDKPTGSHQVFFQEQKKGFCPRSLLVDMSQTFPPLSKYPSTYKEENILHSKTPSFGIYGQTKYNWQTDFKERIEDRIRKQIELCDKVAGFLLVGSLGGGAGSGLTSNVLVSLRNDTPHLMVQSFRQMPPVKQYAHPLQIYNSTFAIFNEVEYADMTSFFDTPAVARNLVATQGKLLPSKEEVHKKVGEVIADATIPYRFKGDLNTSFRKVALNLVLYPRMHFLQFYQSKQKSGKQISSVLNPRNGFFSWYIDPSQAVFNMYAGFRSSVLSQNEAVQSLKNEFKERHFKSTEWISDNIHLSLHDPIDGEQTVAFVNGHHISQSLKRLGELFTLSFRRKAFLHHYTSTGMDEMEFTQAESALNDLYFEYVPNNHLQYQDAEEYDDSDFQ